ncbi:Nicotinamide-nucleotide amidohydrolase PncC [Poriferisphaera corsica]|uniref:CinA-like protein n=1 Tax=Poriferisphaera corsica TaxID=2528020 RepID=A0A517YSA8_9BACT|nr:competence/damage-inducible protein A [Poriferisphaera corsica]QDU33110.1 Nicotinamide-nucleotide amidohydrolase PncC [Poriferisphaera corsica]
MNAAIISIGDELVLGQTVDTNSAWLSERLAAIGVKVGMHITVEDELGAVAEVIEAMCERSCVVLVSGGLGPTEDDLTRAGLARAMGVDVVQSEEMLASVEGYFRDKIGREMPARNRVQAMKPVGTEMIKNDWGTAPGIRAELDGATVFVMPGVPSEMRGMYEHCVEPAIQEIGKKDEVEGMGTLRRVILTKKVNTFGLGESDVGERLGKLMRRDRNPVVGTTVSEGICGVRIRAEYEDADGAEKAIAETVGLIEEKMGRFVFGCDDERLQDAVVQALQRTNRTVATAESCTGGLIGKMITDVSGSSDVYKGGYVTYSNEMKMTCLGVPKEVLEAYGAVSREVAGAMAKGVIEQTGSDYGVGVTGIAGPGGGSDEKPVGTVWIGIASRAKNGEIRCYTALLNQWGDRARVRDRAAKCCLQALRFVMLDEPIEKMSWVREVAVIGGT